MADGPKGGSGLLAILAGSPKKAGGLPLEEDSPKDASFRAVARAFGIPEERQAAAKSALHAYVMQCMSEGDGASESYEDSEV